MSSESNNKVILSIDFGTKQWGLALRKPWSIPIPVGNIANDGDLWFSLMGLIAEHRVQIILIGYPKNLVIRAHIDQAIKTLEMMDDTLEIIRVDENYTSVQAQAITGETGKHIAHDTLAAIEILNRYLQEKNS